MNHGTFTLNHCPYGVIPVSQMLVSWKAGDSGINNGPHRDPQILKLGAPEWASVRERRSYAWRTGYSEGSV